MVGVNRDRDSRDSYTQVGGLASYQAVFIRVLTNRPLNMSRSCFCRDCMVFKSRYDVSYVLSSVQYPARKFSSLAVAAPCMYEACDSSFYD